MCLCLYSSSDSTSEVVGTWPADRVSLPVRPYDKIAYALDRAVRASLVKIQIALPASAPAVRHVVLMISRNQPSFRMHSCTRAGSGCEGRMLSMHRRRSRRSPSLSLGGGRP